MVGGGNGVMDGGCWWLWGIVAVIGIGGGCGSGHWCCLTQCLVCFHPLHTKKLDLKWPNRDFKGIFIFHFLIEFDPFLKHPPTP